MKRCQVCGALPNEPHRITQPPITKPCPVCNARVSEPCSAPTDTGRRYVRWFHQRREDLADEH